MGRGRNAAPTKQQTAWAGGKLLPHGERRRLGAQLCAPTNGDGRQVGNPFGCAQGKLRRTRPTVAGASPCPTERPRLQAEACGTRNGEGVGGIGCDGQEAAALAFGGPSRQVLLPYGRRLRRLRRLQTCATKNGERLGAQLCAPTVRQRLTGWKPVPPRTATAAGAGGADEWSPRGGEVVGGRGCDGQEAAALAFGMPSRQLLLPYGERRDSSVPSE